MKERGVAALLVQRWWSIGHGSVSPYRIQKSPPPRSATRFESLTKRQHSAIS